MEGAVTEQAAWFRAQKYNRVLWKLDLRENRAGLLRQYRSKPEKESENSADRTRQTAGTGK